MENNNITFTAEVRSVTTKKLVSNDIEHKVTFNTSEQEVIELAKIPADSLVKVTVEVL